MTDRPIDPKDIKPARVPFKCVVCNGFGTVNWGKAKCHACFGKGYILVPVEETSDNLFEKKGDK